MIIFPREIIEDVSSNFLMMLEEFKFINIKRENNSLTFKDCNATLQFLVNILEPFSYTL